LNVIRLFSLFLRKYKERRDSAKALEKTKAWVDRINSLQLFETKRNTLALVRLDDIGDYLLFRNFLINYKSSGRFNNYKITLIANIAWKEIFDCYDSQSVDDVIWVSKSRYLNDTDYREKLWTTIRRQGFEITIDTSRTRPILLNDTMTLAINSPIRIGNKNTTRYPKWNEFSDTLYTSIYNDSFASHEFLFNKNFTAWAVNEEIGQSAPVFSSVGVNANDDSKRIICFIGASAMSRRWPANRWIEFVRILIQNGFTPILAGGTTDINIARQIESAIKVDSIVGITSLPETFEWIKTSRAVVTGDTMAAHAAVSLNKPTIIISNGVNAARFVEYGTAGISKVAINYAKPYLDYLSNETNNPFYYFDGVTSDMKTISPEQVYKNLCGVLTL
jgi:ADP-heptose:LPS heptosyltransferase